MLSITELRKKITGIKSIQQVTKAMKMIAGARYARAQRQMLDSAEYSSGMDSFVLQLLEEYFSAIGSGKTPPGGIIHPMLRESGPGDAGLFIITSDKGLCGGFNSSIFAKASEFKKENAGKKMHYFVAGKKGRDFFRRQGAADIREWPEIPGDTGFEGAQKIAGDISGSFARGEVGEVTMIYNSFKSVLKRSVNTVRLLPVGHCRIQGEKNPNFILESDIFEMVGFILPKFIASKVYSAMLESYTAELAARMLAMDSATQNALELIDSITLVMNKVRQANITRELTEIIGAMEAVK